ncbi:MAG: hypothetical protein OIF57_12305 [Marinobacterium sp.]|nr:hypothetical protein [Marinobacterium sp.]
MTALLRTLSLTALSAALIALPVNASSMSEQTAVISADLAHTVAPSPSVIQVLPQLADTCTRESRRPIREVLSGRCTEETPPHYFADTSDAAGIPQLAAVLPDCNCRLEQDEHGHSVLRLSLPLVTLPVVPETKSPAVPAVFRPDLKDHRSVAHIL